MGLLDSLAEHYDARCERREILLEKGDVLYVEYSGDASQIEALQEQMNTVGRLLAKPDHAPPEYRDLLPIAPSTLKACLVLSEYVKGGRLAGGDDADALSLADWMRLSKTTGSLVMTLAAQVSEIVFGDLMRADAERMESEKNASSATVTTETF